MRWAVLVGAALLAVSGAGASAAPSIRDLLAAETALDSGISIRSWTEIRDARIVKQRFDTSCGAASLATILGVYYGEETDEADLMDIMGLKGAYSFADLAYAAEELGYKATPVFAHFDTLRRLRVPVILFVDDNGRGHFTVLRGTDGESVWLGDPAWGNVYLSRADFERRWKQTGSGLGAGFALVVLKSGQSVDEAFFGLSNAERRRFFVRVPEPAALAHRSSE